MEDLDLEDAERSELGETDTPTPGRQAEQPRDQEQPAGDTGVCGRGARDCGLKAYTNLSKGVRLWRTG